MGRRELAAFTKFAREVRPQSKLKIAALQMYKVFKIYLFVFENEKLIIFHRKSNYFHRGRICYYCMIIFVVILENPGIAFTRVASMLAEKWQMLSDKDREHYEELARETATTKKVVSSNHLIHPL